MIVANEASLIVICPDSCAAYWEQILWQELWEVGHQEQETIVHVIGCAHSTSPGNDEADALKRVG